jgi:enoyl-CoA hydratase
MSDTRKILIEKRGEIAVLTLNAPEKRNAIDLEMVNGLHAALDELLAADDVSVLVLIGAGDRAFAAGADIAQLKERKGSDALAAINSAIFKRIDDFPVPSIAAIKGDFYLEDFFSPWTSEIVKKTRKPWIAAVNGFALGGGCELAIACDLRVAGTSAKMGQPEVGLGIIPAAGGTYRLPRLVGLGKARELIYTGRIIDAQECLRIGLVNDVVDDDKVLVRALEIAGEIASRGRLAVRLAKATMNALSRPGEAAAVSMESIAQSILFDSEDKHARMQAFLDRKKK